jgi:hypothetical protein
MYVLYIRIFKFREGHIQLTGDTKNQDKKADIFITQRFMIKPLVSLGHDDSCALLAFARLETSIITEYVDLNKSFVVGTFLLRQSGRYHTLQNDNYSHTKNRHPGSNVFRAERSEYCHILILLLRVLSLKRPLMHNTCNIVLSRNGDPTPTSRCQRNNLTRCVISSTSTR